jgi:uncharacterized membrane protein
MTDDSLFLSDDDQALVIAAIQEAEMQTSGEIKVHIEKKCAPSEVLERAKEVFVLLNMHQTEAHNGVLFYLAYEDRKFAILGDRGINDRVPSDFWNSTKEHVFAHFASSHYALGLKEGILEAGQQLKIHFPRRPDDINELPDEISFGS